jgi:diguanylate cyclase (GGDEF)-like protein
VVDLDVVKRTLTKLEGSDDDALGAFRGSVAHRRTREPFTVLQLDWTTSTIAMARTAGDRAVKRTAAALKARLREVDAVGRFGGEEFLALIAGATVDTDRLRTALLTNAPRVESAVLLLAASIGVARWREPAEKLSRLLMRARRALPRKVSGVAASLSTPQVPFSTTHLVGAL